MVRELIVVEGKKDAEVVKRAFPKADVMITGGWGLKGEQIRMLQRANESRGIIILTDPDHAGEMIRRKLSRLLPGCRHAFIPRCLAMQKGKVGVEAAPVAEVARAIRQVRTQGTPEKGEFALQDLVERGLTGTPTAASKRKRLGELLAIGYANSKVFLKRLNLLGVTREEFDHACKQVEEEKG